MTLRVFYVDDEEDLVWSTTRQLTRERPDFEIHAYTSPLEALAALKVKPPDVLVTDLRMEGMSGLELLVAAREVVDGLPAVLVTAYGSPAVLEAVARRGSIEYLEKPFVVAKLGEAIDAATSSRQGFSGAVARLSITDLIQIHSLGRFSGALEMVHGRQSACLWFSRGEILHAVSGSLRGEEAVFALLGWSAGSFSVDPKALPPEQTISKSCQQLLLEGCQRMDEDGLPDEGLTLGDETLGDEVDERPSTEVLFPGSATTDGDPLQAWPAGSVWATEAAGPAAGSGPHHELELDALFARLRAVDGFVGAVVVRADTEALVGLDARAEAAAGVEAAALGEVTFVRAVSDLIDQLGLDDQIEDLVVSLPGEHHLSRPIRGLSSTFVFVVLDRGQSNLALARLQLGQAERTLSASRIEPLP